MLALRRSFVRYREDTLAGEWQRSGQFCFFNHPISDLGVGTSRIIGRRRARPARGRDRKILGIVMMFAAHKGKTSLGPLYTAWDEVLETSDIITLHSPLTGDAQHDRDGRIPPHEGKPLIINTARGGFMVEDDLERALAEWLVSGAGIDVRGAGQFLPARGPGQ
jgi:glycerate dehydrogenase